MGVEVLEGRRVGKSTSGTPRVGRHCLGQSGTPWGLSAYRAIPPRGACSRVVGSWFLVGLISGARGQTNQVPITNNPPEAQSENSRGNELYSSHVSLLE